MVKNYKVKNDIIFSYIFSNEGILKEFLEAILEKKIEKVEVENQFKLNRHNFKEKLGVLDIKATINNDTLVDVEMQNNVYKSYIQRIYLYFGGLVKSQVKKGMTYDSLKDVIIINILNESMFEKIDKVHTVWQLREKNNLEHEPLKGLSVHFIDLERFRKSNPDLEKELNQWLAFVDTENQEWVNFVMENNKKIEEASKLKEDFTADGVTQEMLDLYEKWDMDERTLIKEARDAGKSEGEKIRNAERKDRRKKRKSNGSSKSNV